jgi:hypothetical protein
VRFLVYISRAEDRCAITSATVQRSQALGLSHASGGRPDRYRLKFSDSERRTLTRSVGEAILLCTPYVRVSLNLGEVAKGVLD